MISSKPLILDSYIQLFHILFISSNYHEQGFKTELCFFAHISWLQLHGLMEELVSHGTRELMLTIPADSKANNIYRCNSQATTSPACGSSKIEARRKWSRTGHISHSLSNPLCKPCYMSSSLPLPHFASEPTPKNLKSPTSVSLSPHASVAAHLPPSMDGCAGRGAASACSDLQGSWPCGKLLWCLSYLSGTFLFLWGALSTDQHKSGRQAQPDATAVERDFGSLVVGDLPGAEKSLAAREGRRLPLLRGWESSQEPGLVLGRVLICYKDPM